jgi:hypothetical protein
MLSHMIFQGEHLIGGSRTPTNIEVSGSGFGIGVFKRAMYPWDSISDISIQGPGSKESRVTATRLLALGVFAIAAKKNTSETLVIVTLGSGQVLTVMFSKKTDPEVRAIFAPHMSKISNLQQTLKESRQPSVVSYTVESTDKAPNLPKTRTEQLKDLISLLERGLIDENEFRDLKTNFQEIPQSSDLLGANNLADAKDGDEDEDGRVYVVRGEMPSVRIDIVKCDTSKFDMYSKIVDKYTLDKFPSPDSETTKAEKKYRQKRLDEYRQWVHDRFYKIDGLERSLWFDISILNDVIADFEELGFEVEVWSETLNRGLPKNTYHLVSIKSE